VEWVFKRPLGIPFLRLDVTVACTGISTPWCHLVKPSAYIKVEITKDMLYSITNLPSQMCGIDLEGVEIVFSLVANS